MKAFLSAAMAGFLALQSPAMAETARVNGVDLHYQIKGAGEPLLLLHGFGSCGAEWERTADEFAKHYRVFVIDMRGHGQSTNPSGSFTHRQSAEDLRALMDSLAIKQARAVGFSSGGMTLLHLAVEYPDRLRALVVISATTHFPEQAREILQSASVETLPPPVLAQYQRCAAHGAGQIAELVAQFRSFGFSKTDMNLTATDLARIKAPTLIVHGDRDPFFPVAIPVAMADAIPHAALWIVPFGDHSPTAGADEDVFFRTVSAFLANPAVAPQE